MTDAEYLDFLCVLNLPLVAEDGVAIAIRFADVPAVLQNAFDNFISGAACPVISGERYAWKQDWQLFLNQEKSRCQKRVWETALIESQAGPTAADLATAPMLSNWIVAREQYFGGVTLMGTPSGHPLLQGPLIATSRLCGLDQSFSWARTSTRWYRLGEMSDFETLKASYPFKLRDFANVSLTIMEAREILRKDFKAAVRT